MKFDVVGTIAQVETIAAGPSVKVRSFLRKTYGRGRWRKLKGIATVRLPNGFPTVICAEWSCIGMKLTASAKGNFKIKEYLNER